ncbi:LuxR C-terminal-related transcriptional regulator [Uliginosibacterium sp. sgz301328]|uniref:LuxR C-terminal-related transcriptional regulator n=1 Tax=Uliginosibacterium sp. sgz301328 TaxID=3243764 RepID=UPI00359E7227
MNIPPIHGFSPASNDISKNTEADRSRPTTVVIIDKHPLMRLALGQIIDDSGQFKVMGQGTDSSSGLQLVKTHQPDIIVVDIFVLPDGERLVDAILNLHWRPRVLIFTAADARRHAGYLRNAGCSGYISKTSPPAEILNALFVVKSGYQCFPEVPTSAFERNDPVQCLSGRERQVMNAILSGSRNKDIANTLNVSPKTVSTYKMQIMRKFGINSIAELVEIAKGGRAA